MLVKDVIATYMPNQLIKLFQWKKKIDRKGQDKSDYQQDWDVNRIRQLQAKPELHEMKCKIILWTSGLTIVGETYVEIYILKDQMEE